MYSQISLLVGLACATLAYPRTYQEQRQIYYSQPIPLPITPYQLPQQQQQVVQYQLPASTSLLPNNVPGLRYGQQQVVYVVPGGGQLLYEEGSTGGQGGYLESFVNYLNGHLPQRPGAQAPEKPAEKPAEGGSAENAITASQEQESSAEQVTPAAELLKQPEPQQPQQQQPQQVQQPLQLQQLQQQPQLLQQPQVIPQPSQQDQQLLQQQLLQRFYLYQQPQQALFPRPAIAGPSANYLLNYRTYPLSDKKPGSSAIAFQKLLQKNAEAAAAAAGNATENETSESDAPSAEEVGPSIAQAKPQAVSVAGPGGVAAAAPVATAIVGPGGMALSAPTATAVAGTKPKPSDKTRSGYLSRTNLYPF